MRNFIILLSLSFIISSCQKGIDNNFQFLDPEAFLLVPASYKNEQSLVFVNKSNEEQVFDILHIKWSDSLAYEFDHEIHNFVIESKEFGNELVNIFIGLAPDFLQEVKEDYSTVLSVNLSPGLGATISVNIVDGQISSETFIPKDVTYLDRNFTDVYSATPSNLAVFNAVAYNAEFGLIMFKDGQGEQWVFDRFE